MACRVPVIASKIGGLVEIVADGETGFLLEPEDVDGVAKKVVLLLQDEKLRKRMWEAGRRRVEDHFTAFRMARDTFAVYQRALEGKAV